MTPIANLYGHFPSSSSLALALVVQNIDYF
jgi:hypothetical protein